MSRYHGITYPFSTLHWVWMWELIYRVWRRLCCPHGWHLLDECVASGNNGSEHTLDCDACGLTVWIERIDDQPAT